MLAIGFRADGAAVHYAVVDGDTSQIVDDGKVRIQSTSELAEGFALLRTQLMTVLKASKAEVAGIKFADRPMRPVNPIPMLPRARVEGVVLEAIGAFGIASVSGAAQTIKSGIKTRTPLRNYAAAGEIRGIDISGKNKFIQDAVFAAVSALGD